MYSRIHLYKPIKMDQRDSHRTSVTGLSEFFQSPVSILDVETRVLPSVHKKETALTHAAERERGK